MRCTNCNHENEHNAVFCANCGGWVFARIYDKQETSPALPEETAQDSPAFKKRVRRIAWTVAGCLALIGLVLVLWITHREPGSRYIYKESSILTHYASDKLLLVQDGLVAAAMDVQKRDAVAILTESLDGRTALCFCNYKLIAVRDGECIFEIFSVRQPQLAASGMGFVYLDSNSLHYFNVQTKRGYVICYNLFNEQAVISPDGQAVAYIQNGALRYWSGEKEDRVIQADVGDFQLLGLSDNGQQFYVCNETTLGCYDEEGKLTLIADSTYPDSTFRSASPYDFYFNADHSQLLFHSGTKTYLSTNGHKAELYCDAILKPLCADGTAWIKDNSSITLPVYQMDDMVFYQDHSFFIGSAVSGTLQFTQRIWKGGKMILDECREPILDRSGRVLHYYGEDQDLMQLDLSGGKKPKKLADSVTDYFVSPDCKTVYYRKNLTLYRCGSGLGGDTKITDSFGYALSFTPSGLGCYVQLGTLYIIREDECIPILEHGNQLIIGSDGAVYVTAMVQDLYHITDNGEVVPVHLVDSPQNPTDCQ